MKRTETVRVLGPSGVRGTASRRSIAAAGGVTVALDDGRTVRVPRASLSPVGRGVYRFTGDRSVVDDPRPDRLVVPVVQEELDVGKRKVDRGGVRVRVIPGERREVVDVPLERRGLRVERVPVGREVDGPLQAREEEGVLIFPVVEEVLVVQKKWVLREEVRISVERTRTNARESVTLRTETASVERLKGGGREDAEGSMDGPAAGPGDRRGTRSRARR